MEKTVSYKEYLVQTLENPAEAAAYLNAALEEEDLSVFTLALRDVVDSLGGGVGSIAQKTHLNRESLYRMLSHKGNPRLRSLNSVIHCLGFEMTIKPKSDNRHLG